MQYPAHERPTTCACQRNVRICSCACHHAKPCQPQTERLQSEEHPRVTMIVSVARARGYEVGCAGHLHPLGSHVSCLSSWHRNGSPGWSRFPWEVLSCGPCEAEQCWAEPTPARLSLMEPSFQSYHGRDLWPLPWTLGGHFHS